MSALPRLLTLMGSGETAPTMVKTHRALLARLGAEARAVVLDTPYGFQENAPELAQRAIEYFRQSVGHPIEVAGLASLADVDPMTLEQGLSRLRRADYVFAGPGSPTYALRQWAGTPVPGLIADKLRDGGAVTFASAAALTLGRFTVPVYEIYKSGHEPFWLDGLDVLSAVGLPVVVIPHYDNTEGGHHDTRFCYLGERRLRLLEGQLPAGVHVLGVDEHTGVMIDLDAETATVVGNSTLTIRVQGESVSYRSGAVLPLIELREPGRSGAGNGAAPSAPVVVAEPEPAAATSLAAEAEAALASFDRALADRDAAAACGAVLGLESAIAAWSADTLQSDELDRARAALREMIVRLGESATGGLIDPRTVVGPYVEVLLELRAAVRAEKRYELSDLIRDRLDTVGVEVRDTAAGAEWELRSAP